ncbi:MAG: methyltransferase domain-containing protein [Pseudolabrys sp.]|nr:methyltransferase domain-containing protein [Pseudolabrys sp.]
MAEQQIRFDDGASYERFMGVWSRSVGEIFLGWLGPSEGLRWIDIGCGNGAFTELLVERCAPAEVQGVDPSEGQLKFARSRPAARLAKFQIGDAMSLPFPDNHFDAAVMALVLFFVPEPAKGVAEMARVARPGGLVSAYAWDILGGGFPLQPLWEELEAFGQQPTLPPSPEASRIDAMQALWRAAGLQDIETREITVNRTFVDFDEFWAITLMSPAAKPVLTALGEQQLDLLKSRTRARLPVDAAGHITYSARANAVKGTKPK